ncbi:MAG: hypothetical protein AAFN93_03215 [Bacteroidota bacterium]
MNVRYEKLFSVEFNHSYYNSGKYNGFGIETDVLTDQFINSYGLLTRKTEGGLIVLFKEIENKPSLLRNLEQELKLTFYLTLTDSEFINYSNLVPDSLNRPYYLSNMGTDGIRTIFLHTGEIASENDRVLSVNSITDLFNHANEKLEEISIKDRTGKVIFEGKADDPELELIEADLQGQGFLLVDFNAKGEYSEFYFSNSGRRHLFAAIEIFFKPRGEEGSFSDILDSTFVFSLDARSVIWKYFFINRSKVNYKDFKILDGTDTVPTTEAIKVKLLDGSEALKIETREPIPLKERYSTHLELEMTKNGSASINQIIKNRMSLPAPEVRQVRIAQTGDVYNAYSEMYVYF